MFKLNHVSVFNCGCNLHDAVFVCGGLLYVQCVFEHVYIMQSEISLFYLFYQCKSIGRRQRNPEGHLPRAEIYFKVSVS